jgi:hypothetical protein
MGVEGGGVRRKCTAVRDGVVMVVPLRSARGVAELSAGPLTGFDKRVGWGGGIGVSGRVVNHAGEVLATVMMYP